MDKSYYCYIIYSNNNTYNGYTVNLKRRLRQHDGELVGGAKSTHNKGPWNYLMIFHAPTWTQNQAMSVEYTIRYPTRKKPRPKIYQGVQGRINSIPIILAQIDYPINLYIKNEYINEIKQNINNDNIKIFDINDII